MEHKAYWTLKFLNFDEALSRENRKLQLLELEEMRLNAYESSRLKLFPGKLKSKWSGPFTIKEVKPYGAVELFDPQSETPDRTWIVNGQRLKLYHGGNIERLTIIMQLQDP
ncbi:uncharacterized protein LOC114415970 [Glycine soja]|uniref:uncharacterized protein n=1 Tax=Glycine max TaxID=3847 RepID=UPI0003DEB79B|nr:uncharacterized protein LOC102666044 [Glycine max]XP_028236639.1 uncharacterized protein LOC114415970 [Glycine soja]|eukprot:XP_006582573.1 uncharacterized protein LOC102666044 [Glycine max]